jgi:hypothetical protein
VIQDQLRFNLAESHCSAALLIDKSRPETEESAAAFQTEKSSLPMRVTREQRRPSKCRFVLIGGTAAVLLFASERNTIESMRSRRHSKRVWPDHVVTSKYDLLKDGHSEHLFRGSLPDHTPGQRPGPVIAAGNSAITAQLLAAAEMN